MSTITDNETIRLFSLKAARSAIKLEILGMKHSRGSVTARIKKHFNWKGNKKSIYAQLDAYIKEVERGFNEEQYPSPIAENARQP